MNSYYPFPPLTVLITAFRKKNGWVAAASIKSQLDEIRALPVTYTCPPEEA